jgi:hypothetical protein
MPTKQEALREALTQGQGVDIRAKMQVDKIKAEYMLIHECAEEWEKICVKHKLNIAQMDQVWKALQDRQNRILSNEFVSKTIRPNLNLVDRNGQPIDI